jgi:diaminopimelate decarboxylase
LSELAQTYGTPLYVIDEATVRAACRAYRDALAAAYPGPSLALYASKANSSLALTALVASEGLGLDAVSAGELLHGPAGGHAPTGSFCMATTNPEGNCPGDPQHGVTVVVDNWLDLEHLKLYRQRPSHPRTPAGAVHAWHRMPHS